MFASHGHLKPVSIIVFTTSAPESGAEGLEARGKGPRTRGAERTGNLMSTPIALSSRDKGAGRGPGK
ncbi:hypothetical protein ADJ70_06660 [Olsenella sp. oral taxon 807]|nr:hypothetical protein ADJ70_06660 [Olsenella sp. oral taxon 807]